MRPGDTRPQVVYEIVLEPNFRDVFLRLLNNLSALEKDGANKLLHLLSKFREVDNPIAASVRLRRDLIRASGRHHKANAVGFVTDIISVNRSCNSNPTAI